MSDKTKEIDAIEAKFDAWSKGYQEHIESHITAAALPIFVQYVKAAKPKRVLEVGCGPGRGALQLLNSLDASVEIVSSDLAQGMADLARATVEKHRTDSSPKISVEIQNGESLTFADKSFDAYLSNMCMMLAPNPDKFISECRRVLTDGGVACMSVWGRPEHSLGFCHLDVYKKYAPLANEHKGEELFAPVFRSEYNYHLGGDKEKLRQRFLDAGFSNVVTWYTPGHFPWFDGQTYADVIFSFAPFSKLKECLPEHHVKQAHADLAARVDEGIKSGEPMKFDVLCVAAKV